MPFTQFYKGLESWFVTKAEKTSPNLTYRHFLHHYNALKKPECLNWKTVALFWTTSGIPKRPDFFFRRTIIDVNSEEQAIARLQFLNFAPYMSSFDAQTLHT
jgi:hypothetical protein